MKTTEIKNVANVLDSRDIAARIEELREDRKRLDADDLQKESDAAEGVELKALEELQEEVENVSSEWADGEIGRASCRERV